MKVSISVGAPLLGALLSFSTVLGCNAEETDGFGDKAVSIDLVEPACAEPGSPAGYIEGNGFGALNVTITVGGIEAMVLTATGAEASFIIPEAPGPTEVIVTNPGGRPATSPGLTENSDRHETARPG